MTSSEGGIHGIRTPLYCDRDCNQSLTVYLDPPSGIFRLTDDCVYLGLYNVLELAESHSASMRDKRRGRWPRIEATLSYFFLCSRQDLCSVSPTRIAHVRTVCLWTGLTNLFSDLQIIILFALL